MSHIRTALVRTDAPARYAKQLASHLGRKMTVSQDGDATVLTMSFDEQEATCRMEPGKDVLDLRASSASEAAADQMASVVGSHLERFGARDGVQVSWT